MDDALEIVDVRSFVAVVEQVDTQQFDQKGGASQGLRIFDQAVLAECLVDRAEDTTVSRLGGVETDRAVFLHLRADVGRAAVGPLLGAGEERVD
ncbi:hypothetical protein [Streptomyces albidochromogenes]|uniref:hypothetical protein n=1 Tax=Streptomyces albidochromogenes TaxID=329524 RepID=UPI003CD0BC29